MGTGTWVPELPVDTFGRRLRVLRIAMGELSIEDVAARCDIPAATWRTWEHGAKPRDMAEKVRKIHQATGADPNWLMWGTPSNVAPISRGMSFSSGITDDSALFDVSEYAMAAGL